MASKVYLVRHGEVHNPDGLVYADLPGFGLSARGRRQALWAGEFLASRPIGAVYTSPLDRAIQTASAITPPHHLDYETAPALTEWALLRRWRGLAWAELDHHRPGELSAYLTHPLEMGFAPESVEELAARIGGTISALAGRHPDGQIVVVSHQDPIQTARLHLTGRPLERLHDQKPRHCEVITLVPGNPWRETARITPEF